MVLRICSSSKSLPVKLETEWIRAFRTGLCRCSCISPRQYFNHLNGKYPKAGRWTSPNVSTHLRHLISPSTEWQQEIFTFYLDTRAAVFFFERAIYTNKNIYFFLFQYMHRSFLLFCKIINKRTITINL